ncbi:hypothetical protein ACR79H_16625 [Sphingobacterium spiritivorum]
MLTNITLLNGYIRLRVILSAVILAEQTFVRCWMKKVRRLPGPLKSGIPYDPEILSNGNPLKQLMTRESFNAKLKTFRSVFRGVRDAQFFLYRVMKLYA